MESVGFLDLSTEEYNMFEDVGSSEMEEIVAGCILKNKKYVDVAYHEMCAEERTRGPSEFKGVEEFERYFEYHMQLKEARKKEEGVAFDSSKDITSVDLEKNDALTRGVIKNIQQVEVDKEVVVISSNDRMERGITGWEYVASRQEPTLKQRTGFDLESWKAVLGSYTFHKHGFLRGNVLEFRDKHPYGIRPGEGYFLRGDDIRKHTLVGGNSFKQQSAESTRSDLGIKTRYCVYKEYKKHIIRPDVEFSFPYVLVIYAGPEGCLFTRNAEEEIMRGEVDVVEKKVVIVNCVLKTGHSPQDTFIEQVAIIGIKNEVIDQFFLEPPSSLMSSSHPEIGLLKRYGISEGEGIVRLTHAIFGTRVIGMGTGALFVRWKMHHEDYIDVSDSGNYLGKVDILHFKKILNIDYDIFLKSLVCKERYLEFRPEMEFYLHSGRNDCSGLFYKGMDSFGFNHMALTPSGMLAIITKFFGHKFSPQTLELVTQVYIVWSVGGEGNRDRLTAIFRTKCYQAVWDFVFICGKNTDIVALQIGMMIRIIRGWMFKPSSPGRTFSTIRRRIVGFVKNGLGKELNVYSATPNDEVVKSIF